MEYKVIRVSKNRELKDFLNLSYSIYNGSKFWVPPIRDEIRRVLNPQKNPYYQNASLCLFSCYQGNKIISRASVVINKRYEIKYGIKCAQFGFFESRNNHRAASLLFNSIESYCKESGVTVLEGPFNPNHYSEIGLLLNCFEEPPAFFETYNPKYYRGLLEEAGFSISKLLHTRLNPDIAKYINKRYPKGLNIKINNASIRLFNIKEKNADLEKLRKIFNDAFSKNWHFLPVSSSEYLFSSKHLGLVTTPNLLRFIEIDGETVGAIHFALDINPLLKSFNGKFHPLKYLRLLNARKSLSNLVFFAIGIKEKYKRTKVFGMLLSESIKIAKNYKVLSTTWMDAENKIIINAAERLGLKPKKEYAIFEKKLFPE